VEFHPRFHAAPPHRPSAPCRASRRTPQPSVATLARSAATSCAGTSVRSRITCQRIEGSESSSQRMTDLFCFEDCRLGGLIAICWFLLTLVKAAGGASIPSNKPMLLIADMKRLCRKTPLHISVSRFDKVD
jgi:hypothetical protein